MIGLSVTNILQFGTHHSEIEKATILYIILIGIVVEHVPFTELVPNVGTNDLT